MLATVIQTRFTIDATIDNFDADAFTAKLAAALSVPLRNIALTVIPGSVIVAVSIAATSAAEASAVSNTFGTYVADPAAASTALSVDIVSVSQPTSTAMLVAPPAPSQGAGEATAGSSSSPPADNGTSTKGPSVSGGSIAPPTTPPGESGTTPATAPSPTPPALVQNTQSSGLSASGAQLPDGASGMPSGLHVWLPIALVVACCCTVSCGWYAAHIKASEAFRHMIENAVSDGKIVRASDFADLQPGSVQHRLQLHSLGELVASDMDGNGGPNEREDASAGSWSGMLGATKARLRLDKRAESMRARLERARRTNRSSGRCATPRGCGPSGDAADSVVSWDVDTGSGDTGAGAVPSWDDTNAADWSPQAVQEKMRMIGSPSSGYRVRGSAMFGSPERP